MYRRIALLICCLAIGSSCNEHLAPVHSPDGQRLLVLLMDDDTIATLRIVDIDGNNAVSYFAPNSLHFLWAIWLDDERLLVSVDASGESTTRSEVIRPCVLHLKTGVLEELPLPATVNRPFPAQIDDAHGLIFNQHEHYLFVDIDTLMVTKRVLGTPFDCGNGWHFRLHQKHGFPQNTTIKGVLYSPNGNAVVTIPGGLIPTIPVGAAVFEDGKWLGLAFDPDDTFFRIYSTTTGGIHHTDKGALLSGFPHFSDNGFTAVERVRREVGSGWSAESANPITLTRFDFGKQKDSWLTIPLQEADVVHAYGQCPTENEFIIPISGASPRIVFVPNRKTVRAENVRSIALPQGRAVHTRLERLESSATLDLTAVDEIGFESDNSDWIRFTATSEKTLEQCISLIASNPFNAQHWLERGFAYHQRGELDNAIRDYTTALSIAPEMADALNNRGRAYNQRGEYERALSDLNRAITLAPTDADVPLNRGYAYLRLERYSEALVDFTRSIALNSTRFQPYIGRSNVYFEQEKFDNAIADLERVLELKPDLESVRSNLARCYAERARRFGVVGKLPESVAASGRAINLQVDSPVYHNNMATALIRSGDYQGAIRHAETSIALGNDIPDIYASVASCAYRLGQDIKAAAFYEQALKRAPNTPFWGLYRFFLYARSVGLDTARTELFERGRVTPVERWPQPVVRLYLGEITPQQCLDLATYDESEHTKERLSEAHFYIGQWYLLLGKTAMADVHFQRTIEQGITHFAEHTDAQFELDRLRQ